MSSLGQRGFAHILLLILLVLGVGVGVYLALNPTVFKPKANVEPNAPFGIVSIKKTEASSSGTPSKDVPSTPGYFADYKFTYSGGAHMGSASGFYPWDLTIDVTKKSGDYPYVALLVTNLQTGSKSIYNTLEQGSTSDQFLFNSDKLNFAYLLHKGDKIQLQLVACVSQGYSNMQSCITDPSTIRFNSVVFTKQDGEVATAVTPISTNSGSMTSQGGFSKTLTLEGWVVADGDMVQLLDVYIDGKQYNRTPGDSANPYVQPFKLDGSDNRVKLIEHKEEGVCGPQDPHPKFRNCPNAGFEITLDLSNIEQFLNDGKDHKIEVKAINVSEVNGYLPWDKPGGDEKAYTFIKATNGPSDPTDTTLSGASYKAKYSYDPATRLITVEVTEAMGGAYPYVGLKIDKDMYKLTAAGENKFTVDVRNPDGLPIIAGQHTIQLRANCDYASQMRFNYCAYGYEEIGEDPSPAGKVIKFNEETVYIK